MDRIAPEVSPRVQYSDKKRGRQPRSRKSMENNRCRPSQDLHQPALAKTVGPAVSLDSTRSDCGSGHATLKSPQRRRIGSSKSDGGASGAGADGGSTRALQAQRSKSASASGDASDFPAGTTSQLRSSKLASSVTTTSDEGNGSKGEDFLQAPLSEAHYKKRRAIAAALARSTFARLRKTNWEDVDIDWRPQEHLLAKERRVCSLLRVDTLGPTSVKDTTSHGGAPTGPGAGVAAAASGSTEGADPTEEKELLMSSVFPLPPPKPPRHVKHGVFANLDAPAEPKETRAMEASATRSHLPFPSRIQRDGSVPEGCLSPLHIRLADRAARVDGSKADETLTETDAVGEEGVPGDDTDGDSVSTSTTVTVDSNLTQYKMTAAERSRAYKDIFRGGGEKAKKRSRSPVARTPLRLPFPMALRGGVGSSAAYRNEELPWGGGHGLNESDSEGALKSCGDGGTSSGGAGTTTEEPKVDPRGKHGDHDVAGALRQRNFRLPYDIMYEYQHDIFYSEVRQLGVRSTADAMEEFKNITSNLYLSKKPPVKDAGEDHKCHCKPPPDGQPGCTETCSNRATNEECTSRTCGLGGSAPCDNRKMQRHKQEDMKRMVFIKDVGAKGIGLVAKRLIPAGSLIGEYVGEVMSEDDWQERQATLGDKQRHKYVMDLGDGEVVDASQSGSILRFVNHSCGPNAETQKWTIQGKQRVGLFATDDILKREEVTFNYCYVRYDEEARECLCGHPSCVKTLGTKHGKGDKEAGAGWSSRGTESCSGPGGGGPGNGAHGRGGRRGRLSPKWEDPETGETVRPWLHTEDAENIERLTIRAINHGGRPHARDLAVGMTKRLFLKRNISLACRRLVAEQAALVAPASVVGAAGKAKSNISTADARSRLRRLQASIARERALCEALGEANQKKVTGERSSQPRDAILPQNSKASIISAAASDAGGARSPFNRTSTSKTRLFVREMQEEVLRVGREVLRTKRCGAPDASSPPTAAAANGPCANGTVAIGSGVTDSGKAGPMTGRWVRRGRSQGAASKTIASAAAESVPTEGNGGGEAPIRRKEGVVAPGRDKDGKAGKEKSLSRARDPRRRFPPSRESCSLHSQRFQMRKETNDEERDERVYSGSIDRYRRRSPSPRKSSMSDNSHYAAEEGRYINRECVRSRSRGSPRRSNSRKESRHSPCLVDRSVASDEGGKTTVGRRRRSRPSLDSASSGSRQGQGESAARSRSPRLEAKGSQNSRTKAADDKRGGSASRSRSKLSMAANSRERGSRGRGRSNPDDRVESENSLSSRRLSSQNRIRNLRSQECRSRNRDDDRTSSGHAAGSDSSLVSIGAKAVNPDNDDAEAGARGDGEGSGVEPLREREILPSRLPTASPRAAEDPRRAGEAANETETFPGVGEKDGAYSSDSDDSVTFVPALRRVKAKYGDDFYKAFRVEAMERLEEEKEVIRVEEGQRLGTMPPSESPSKKARDITGVMIPRATRKLPRDVYRKILDMFQVVILEPLYYPPRSESYKTSPTYVIGPVAHVAHALRLLSDFYSRKIEVSMNNVLKAGMFVTLDIRRVDPGDGFLKRPTSYDITQEEAEALLDRGRLAWLLGECKRITGAVEVCVSRKQWARNAGPAVCKVTIAGTKRQKDEAWQIVKSALERYPLVEDFMRRFPPPWPSPGDAQEGSALQATAEARKEVPSPSPPVTSAPARPRLGFGAGIRMRAEAAAAATSAAPSFTMAAGDGSPSRAAGNAGPVKGGSQSTSSVSGPVAEWEDGWALPVDVVQKLCLQQRTGLYPFGSASKSGLPRGSRYGKTCNNRRRTEGKGLSPNNSRSRSTKSVRERGAPTRTREVAVKGAGSREDGGSSAGHGETNPAVVAPLSKAARGGKRNLRCKPRDRPPNGEHGGDGGEEEATQEEALFSLKVKAVAQETLSSTPSRNGASRAVVCSATSADCGAQTIPSFESHATPLDGEAFAHPVSLEKKPPSTPGDGGREARAGSGTTAAISGSRADSQSTVENTPVASGADRERGGVVTTSGEGGKPLVWADVEATPKVGMEKAPFVVRVGNTAVIPAIETRPATSMGTNHEGRLPVTCSQEKMIPIAPADVGVTPVGGLGETPSVLQVATASVTPRPMVTGQSAIGQNPVTSSEAGGVSTGKISKEPGKRLGRENVDVTPADAMEEAPSVVQMATEKTVGAGAKANGLTTERRLELSTASSPTSSSPITERKRARALAETDATATKKAKQGECGAAVGVCFGKEAAAFAAAVSKRLAHASGGGAANNLVAAAAVGDVISPSKPTHENTVVQLTANTSSLRSSVVMEAAAKLAARLASVGKDASTIAGTLPKCPRSTEKKLSPSRDDDRGNNSDEGPCPSAVRAANANSGMPDTESRDDDSSLCGAKLDAPCSRQASSPRRERTCEGRRRRGREISEEPHGAEDSGASEADRPSGILSRRRSKDRVCDRHRTRKRDRARSCERFHRRSSGRRSSVDSRGRHGDDRSVSHFTSRSRGDSRERRIRNRESRGWRRSMARSRSPERRRSSRRPRSYSRSSSQSRSCSRGRSRNCIRRRSRSRNYIRRRSRSSERRPREKRRRGGRVSHPSRSSSLDRQKRRRRDGRGRESRDRSPRGPDRSASSSNCRRDVEDKRDRVAF